MAQRTLIVGLSAALLAAACGGAPSSSPAAASSAPVATKAVTTTALAPAQAASGAATPTIPPASTVAAGQPGTKVVSEDLMFSGAISGKMTKGVGSLLGGLACGVGTETNTSNQVIGQVLTVGITGAIGASGTPYVFGIGITGQASVVGTFTTLDSQASLSGDASKQIAVSLSTADHKLNLGSLAGGTITVDAGGKSGTVNATLDDHVAIAGITRPATMTVKVSGHWSCG